MNYILILLAKTIENIFATLRIIILSSHKKLLGAFLNLFISLTWIFSTIFVLRNFKTHPVSILVYALGCFIGSYLGGLLEEKLALGDYMLTCITNKNIEIENKLKNLEYNVISIDGYAMEKKEKILLIMIPRRKRNHLYRLIKLIDKKATIICESTSYYSK